MGMSASTRGMKIKALKNLLSFKKWSIQYQDKFQFTNKYDLCVTEGDRYIS